MNWAQTQRQDFIAACLRDRGIVNRSDIINEFRVTAAIASSDLREFKKLNPGATAYNASAKRYERIEPVGTFCCPICLRDSPHSHDMLLGKAGYLKWIGVDFDGTLAYDAETRTDPYSLGEPIMPMVNRVKGWLANHYKVKLLTARMFPYSYSTNQPRSPRTMEQRLKAWCLKHLGVELECTCEKDGLMEVLWDDRAVRVIRDTGSPFKPESDQR